MERRTVYGGKDYALVLTLLLILSTFVFYSYNLSSQLVLIKEQQEELMLEKESIQESFDLVVEKYNSKEEEVSNLKETAQELNDKLNALKTSSESMKKEHQKLKDEVSSTKKENETLLSNNKLLRDKIQKLEKEKKQPIASRGNNNSRYTGPSSAPLQFSSDTSGWTSYTMTHYSPYCPGCSGKSAGGYNLRNGITHNGMRMIAVDPRKIPLHSIVEINDNGNIYRALAVDTGGAIKNNKIDLLVPDRATAYKLGVKKIQLRIVK